MCGTLLPPTRGADHRAAGGGAGSPLTWGIQSHGRLVIIVLGGELDIATAPGLAGQREPLAETDSHLILDLAGMRFCDCAGLSLFLRLKQRSAAAGGALHLTAPTAPVRRLVALTGLHDLLPAAAGPAEVIALPGDAIPAPPLPRSDDADIAVLANLADLRASAASTASAVL
jgi:anti-anti-sigma factor